MKKKTCWQGLLIAVVLAVLVYCLWAVDNVGNHLQYVVETTGDIAEAAAELTSLAVEWETTQRSWTLRGIIQEAAMTAESQVAYGRITLCGDNKATLPLLHGRLFTAEELVGGAPVALLDEQLAFALFRDVNAVDRMFSLGGRSFRVIGVVQHSRRVGDSADCGAYIPLLCGLQPETLLVEADPLPGAGASASFASVCGLWRSGGTFIDLHKEAVRATMWVRVLGFALGCIVLMKLIRWLNARASDSFAHFRRALQQRYAVQLLPQMSVVTLALILGYAAAVWVSGCLLDIILQPVYVFPEYVPAVLVEWEEIRSTFWRVQQSAAALRELRTPELLRLRYFAGLIRICCAVLTALLPRLWQGIWHRQRG